MDSTWYYTLSTIVQALAAIFALSATFLVFKLQSLDQELRKYRNKAIRSLVYLEGKSETKYDDFTLIDISKKFSSRLENIDDPYPMMGVDYDKFRSLKQLWEKLEEGLGYGNEKSFEIYFLALMKQTAQIFNSKVEYRINLYTMALTSGLLLTFVIILSLLMLSGMTHPINVLLFHYSLRGSIDFVTIFASLSIISVMVTAFYAIWGDKY